MNVIDIGIILVLCMSFLVGWKSGVIRELFNVVGIVVVLIISYQLKGLVGNALCKVLPFIKFKGILAGLTAMNILLYQAIAFLLVFGILLGVYSLLISISKFLQEIINFTIVLLLPSKILGGIIGLIRCWLVLFIIIIVLLVPFKNQSIVMESKLVENAIALADNTCSTTVLKKSIGRIWGLKNKSYIRIIVFGVFVLYIAFTLSKSVETIGQSELIISIVQEVLVAVFATVFTGYALFQALLSDTLLIKMLSSTLNNDNEKSNSYIKESNQYFAELMMALFITIVLDVFLRVFLNTVQERWCLFSNNTINEVVSFLVIVVISYINIEVLWETKSFIFNVYELFNAHAMARAIDYIENGDKNEIGVEE